MTVKYMMAKRCSSTVPLPVEVVLRQIDGFEFCAPFESS